MFFSLIALSQELKQLLGCGQKKQLTCLFMVAMAFVTPFIAIAILLLDLSVWILRLTAWILALIIMNFLT